MSYVQRKAIVHLGPNSGSLTEYTCDISAFVINQSRTTVAKAASFGSPDVEEKASAHKASVTMSFLAVPHASSGLWFELRRAQKTVSGELFFQVRYDEAAVSASNPKWTGWLSVIDLDLGAAAYQARRQSKTFPARGISDPITS